MSAWMNILLVLAVADLWFLFDVLLPIRGHWDKPIW